MPLFTLVLGPTMPALVSQAPDQVGMRFLEFFMANICNPAHDVPPHEQLTSSQLGAAKADPVKLGAKFSVALVELP